MINPPFIFTLIGQSLTNSGSSYLKETFAQNFVELTLMVRVSTKSCGHVERKSNRHFLGFWVQLFSTSKLTLALIPRCCFEKWVRIYSLLLSPASSRGVNTWTPASLRDGTIRKVIGERGVGDFSLTWTFFRPLLVYDFFRCMTSLPSPSHKFFLCVPFTYMNCFVFFLTSSPAITFLRSTPNLSVQ